MSSIKQSRLRSSNRSVADQAASDSRHGESRNNADLSASYPSGMGETTNRELTVMVIDDSKTIRRSAESLLQKEGWNVVTAIDGFDALAKVVEFEPDLVFADIMMPRLDGYQTCALIKNNSRYSDTPVIMLSSKDSIFDKARGRVVGSEHYLTKPFTRDDLVSAVNKQIAKKQLQGRSTTSHTTSTPSKLATSNESSRSISGSTTPELSA